MISALIDESYILKDQVNFCILLFFNIIFGFLLIRSIYYIMFNIELKK